MKGLIVALVSLGGLGIFYALSSKMKATATTASQTKGAVDPNYNPTARIFQGKSKNPIIGVLPMGRPSEAGACVYYCDDNVTPQFVDTNSNPADCSVNGGDWFSGTHPDAKPCPKATCDLSTGIGCAAVAGPNPDLIATNSPQGSSSIWAADKIPANVNMPASDADPSLATSWTQV